MNGQQTYRRSSFDVGWMRGTLVYNNPQSSCQLWLSAGPFANYREHGDGDINVLNGMYLKAMFHIDPCIHGKP